MLREIKRLRKSQKGFTLIELMATLAILAMVVAIAVPAVGKIMDNAEAQAEDSSIALIESSGELAYLGGLEFDDTERELYNVPTLVRDGYLTLSEDDALYNDNHYVQKQNDGSFKFVDLIPNPESDFTWSDNGDGTVTITKYIGEDTDVVIPSTINGLTVTRTGVFSFISAGLTSVHIPNTVTYLGAGSFLNNSLEYIHIPDSVVSVRHTVFGNNELITVNIPEGVTEIESYTFSGNKLTTVDIPHGVETIGDSSFHSNELISVYIPASVTSIGEDAFDENSEGMVIYGYSGTTAETYANDNGFIFEALD